MTYRDVNMWEWDQSYATHTRCNCHQFYHPRVVTASDICDSQLRCQERKLSSSSDAKRGSTWWSTIFHISLWPSPTIISAETQLYDAKAKPNYVLNLRGYNDNAKSPSNPNSNSEIKITLLASHNGNRQWITEKSSMEQWIFKKREIAVSDQASPTDKSTAHVEALYQNTPRQGEHNVLKRSVESASMKFTGWSPKRTSKDYYKIKMNLRIYKSMLSTDDYRLQDILLRACRSTAQSSDSASALQLGRYNHLRETYVLRVYTWDYTYLTCMIDDNWWLRPMLAADAPIDAKSWAEALYHPDDCNNDLRCDIRAAGMDGRRSMVSEVELWRMGWLLDVIWFSPLLFFYSLDFGPVQMASARVFTTFGVSQVEMDFATAQDPPKGHPKCYGLVVELLISYEHVRGKIV